MFSSIDLENNQRLISINKIKSRCFSTSLQAFWFYSGNSGLDTRDKKKYFYLIMAYIIWIHGKRKRKSEAKKKETPSCLDWFVHQNSNSKKQAHRLFDIRFLFRLTLIEFVRFILMWSMEWNYTHEPSILFDHWSTNGED